MEITLIECRWGFSVTPNLSFMESLAAALHLDVIFISSSEEQSGSYIWASPHLNDLSIPQSVCDRAYALKAIFDGAVFVEYGSQYEPFDLGSLINLETRRPHRPLVPSTPVLPFSPAFLSAKAPRALSPLQDYVGKYIFLSRFDDATREILALLGTNRLTWGSLHSVLDVLKHHGWTTQDLHARGVVSKQVLKRFFATANCAAASGYHARHGELGRKAPKNPMLLADAVKYILPIIRAFFESRANKVALSEKWHELIL